MLHGRGGLTSNTAEAEPEIVTTVNNRDIKLVVEAKDDKIKFDSEDDLEVTYNVKAQRGDKTDVNFDPYDLTNYANIADEYKPDLTVTTKAVDKESGEELKADNPFFDYIVLPKAKTIYYDTWLASVNKDLGQDITLEFAWGEEVGGLNPQVYADKNNLGLSKTDQEKWFNTLTDTLSGVKFQFVFEVKGVKEDVPPVEEETGEVTLPTVEGSTLSIEGLKDGKLPVGEHTITITTDEGKVVKDNKLTVVENGVEKEVPLTENALTRATAHTYTATYNFVKGATYSFKYELDDEEVPQPTTYKVSVEGNENGTITVTEAGEPIGPTVNEGSKIKVSVKANDGFNIDTVTVGEEIETVNNSTFEKEYTVTSDLTISATYSEIKTEPEYEVYQTGKLGLYQQALRKAYYFDGTITGGRFLGTTDVFEDAVELTSYKSNDVYYLKFVDSEGKDKYLAAEMNGDKKSAFLIQDSPYGWTYNKEYNTYVTTLDKSETEKADYYIGAYNNFDTFSLSETKYIANEGNYAANLVDKEIVIEVTDVTIEVSSNEVEVDKSVTLSSAITPDYASGEVTYEVLDGGTGEVTIDGSRVTGVKEGTVQIVGKVGNVTSDPITITVIPNSGTPEVVEYSYNFEGNPGLELDGGTIELGGVSWSYDKIQTNSAANKPYVGNATTGYSGVQIGSSKNPLDVPWTIKTSLSEGAVITSYNVTLNTGTRTTGGAKYTISFGEHTNEGTFNRQDKVGDNYPVTVVTESDLSISANEFAITLSSDNNVLLCSISFTYYIA